MGEKKQLSPEEFSEARKEAEKEREERNMVNPKKEKPKKEKAPKEPKKPKTKEQIIEAWNEKNSDFQVDITNTSISIPSEVKIIKLTDFINDIRRLRSKLKRAGYKTTVREGKYI
jgi:hypothetical protein